jgi:hypothetical protein
MFLNLWDGLGCLDYPNLKFLNFKVCSSNLIVQILQNLSFIKMSTQINKFSKNWQN